MEQLNTIDDLRDRVAQWRASGQRIAFVPTMGNLHAGHATLVDRARDVADRVVVSIFVNPLQFGANEDFGKYPRTLDADRDLLRQHYADALFVPSVLDMYPRPLAETTKVFVPELSDILCGAHRPGHFVGVATVVARLFNLVQPDAALFGEKDYQQLVIIRRMAQDLGFPIEIMGVPTVRDVDGLAMSSRNSYLSADERAKAPQLFATLSQLASQIQTQSGAEFAELECLAQTELARQGFAVDYISIRRATDLALPEVDENELIVLAAAWLGRTRLIDNLAVRRY